MPELKCGVVTCQHNKQNYCELDAIEVTGHDATVSSETNCGSFVERKGEQYSNSTKNVSAKSDVKCHATECKYNEAYKCFAGKINVMGDDARKTEETKCATFMNK